MNRLPYSQRKRYSNDTATATNTTGSGSSSSSGGSFDWGLIGGWLNSLGGVATGIWGTSDKYTSQMYAQMYEQQRRANTIIWVVIGLVLALGVFLVIRKTK